MNLGTQSTTGWHRLRRWMTVLCVSVFVLSGIAHSIYCTDGPVGAASSHVSALADSDASDAPGAVELPDGTHCHGCATASLPLIEQSNHPLSATSSLPPPQHDALTAIQLQFDPPPPKTLT
jgi:hypothetical protein